MRDISPTLRSLGFLDSEIKTYIAALELGPSTVIEIGNKTNLSRQAIYTAIDSLVKQGLMSSVEKGKKQLYAAESPERLRSIAEAKLKMMEATVKDIKSAADELKLMQRGEKPVVKMFEGKEGFKSMFEDVVATKPANLWDFVNDDAFGQIFNEQELAPNKQTMDKMNVEGRVMALSSTPLSLHRKKTKGRQIFRKDIKFNGNITVYGNKVALLSLKNKLVGVIIESEEIAETMRALYQLAWDSRLE